MLTGIQIAFMIFCWTVILACTGCVIYLVVNMIRARYEEKRKESEGFSQEQIDQIMAMVEKELSKQRDDNIHTDS